MGASDLTALRAAAVRFPTGPFRGSKSGLTAIVKSYATVMELVHHNGDGLGTVKFYSRRFGDLARVRMPSRLDVVHPGGLCRAATVGYEPRPLNPSYGSVKDQL